MLKKILLIPICALTLLLFVGAASAQNNSLPDPGMLPSNPFYFIKGWSEAIGTFLTFDEVNKVERFLNLSETRLAEANALLEENEVDLADEAIERYQVQLNQALAQAEQARMSGLDTDDVLAKVSEATLRHQEVLADVYNKVPDQAKPAIERAMQAGMRGYEESLEAISGQKREAVMEKAEEKREEVETRLERLRNEGIPIPAIPTREEIEERIPVVPEIDQVEDPAQILEQDRGVQEVEVDRPEVPAEAVRDQAPGRP